MRTRVLVAMLPICLAVASLTSGCGNWLQRMTAAPGPAAKTAMETSTRPLALASQSPHELSPEELRALSELAPAAGGADISMSAAGIIDRMGQDAVSVLADPTLNDSDRIAYFRDLLADHLDVPLIGRVVLGKHWRKAAPAQQQAYLAAFETFLLESYARQLGHAAIDSFQVVSTRPTGKQDILVETEVRQAGRDLTVVWRLRPQNETFRVLDLTIEGVSMVLTRRQEFASIIQSTGGRIDGLIDKLRQKNF